jgi:hypothetical protein
VGRCYRPDQQELGQQITGLWTGFYVMGDATLIRTPEGTFIPANLN